MFASGLKFHDAMAKYRGDYWFHCLKCKERSFDTKSAGGTGTECANCQTSRLSNTNGVSIFSAANNGDPIPTPLPIYLPVLTSIEEMLIARTHVCLACYRLPGGSMGYRGSVINLQKLNVAETLNRIPLAVSQLPVVLIVKFGTPANPQGGREFQVRRNAVRDHLVFLKQNNPVYSDITLDTKVIHSLPENGSVLEHIRRIVEEVEVAVAVEPVATEPVAAEPVAAEPVAVDPVPAGGLSNTDDEYDDLDFDEQMNGPDQGGATGQVIGEMGLQREFATQPIDVQENLY
jgi:hypothetical protein